MMRKLYPLVFFSAAAVLVFWKVLLHPEFTLLTGADMASSYYPWFDVASYWLKRGVFLLWDPYVYSGKMNMGEPQPGIFYPLNWIFMLLPARGGGASLDGFQALLILDYFLAGIFTYLLARSFSLSRSAAFSAGIAFAYGGIVAQLYGYLNVLSGFSWMPLVLLFFRKASLAGGWTARLRFVLGSGIFLALSFLPGHHIPPIHTGFFLFLYAVFSVSTAQPDARRREAALAGTALALTAITSLLLTVFQWLPSAQWARMVFRWVGSGPPVRWGEKVPYSILQQSSNLNPQDGLSLVFPYASTGVNFYTGAVVLFLALVGFLFVRKREPMFFGVAGILYFFLSWGRNSALHGWFNTFVPGLWFARELFYYLVPMQLCIALLAGWGLDRIVESYRTGSDPQFRRFLRRAAWGMATLVVAAGALASVLFFHTGLPMVHPFITALAGFASYLFVFGVLLFLLHTGRIGPGGFAASAVLLIVVDLGSHFSRDIRTKQLPEGRENTYVRAFWKAPPAAERLRLLRQSEFFRVDDPDGMFPPNFGDAWRLEATMGHGATALVDYMIFRGTGWSPASNASALMNVVYFPSRTPIHGMERLPGDEPIFRNPRAVPRAFVPARYRCFAAKDALLSWLGSPLFDPRETVLLSRAALERIPSEFRSKEWDEDDGIEVAVAHLRTVGARTAEALPAAERGEFLKRQPPPGWSSGDEIILRLKPDREARFFLAISYLPAGAAAAPLRVVLEGDGQRREITSELPGCPDANVEWQRVNVDLGTLGSGEYTLSVVKDADCTARLDSFRVTRSDRTPAQERGGSAVVTSLTPNGVEIRAQMTRPGLLVLSEVNYPGWEASVDGNPVPLLTGDAIFRTVPVPAGEHAVELRFRPASFRWGLAASLVFLCAAASFLWATRGGRRSSLRPADAVGSSHPHAGIDPDPRGRR